MNKPSKKTDMKKKIYDEVFLAEVMVCVGNTKDPRLSAHTETLERQGKNGTIIRYVVTLESKRDFYGLIHESLHLVQKILTDRGIVFDASNHELIAYYQTYWFKKLWRAINK